MIEQNRYEQALPNRYNSGIGVRDALTFLLVGGGIGAVIALLFAPKSGTELRGEIADVTRKGYDATLEKANELKAQSAEALQTVKEKAEAVYTKLYNRGEALSEAVSETSKAIVNGLDEVQSETARSTGGGRKSASIF